MSAMATAAAVPLISEVAVAQKGPCMQKVAASARVTKARPEMIEPVCAAMNRNTAAENAEPAKYMRCLPDLSDRAPIATMASAVTRYGITDTMPIPKLPRCDKLLM